MSYGTINIMIKNVASPELLGAAVGLGSSIGTAGMAGGPGQPAQDMGKVFQAHGENLEMVRHKWIIPDAEKRLLRRKPSIVVG